MRSGIDFFKEPSIHQASQSFRNPLMPQKEKLYNSQTPDTNYSDYSVENVGAQYTEQFDVREEMNKQKVNQDDHSVQEEYIDGLKLEQSNDLLSVSTTSIGYFGSIIEDPTYREIIDHTFNTSLNKFPSDIPQTSISQLNPTQTENQQLNEQNKTDNKRSPSSRDTRNLIKNFLKSLKSSLSNLEILKILKQLYLHENFRKSQDKTQNSQNIQNEKDLEEKSFDDYIEAIKELIEKYIHCQSFKVISFITIQQELRQDDRCKLINEEVDGHLILQTIEKIVKEKSTFTSKIQYHWIYKNESYYEMTRCIMFWYLRRHYTAHIFNSPNMTNKARNLKYIRRWLQELKYPGRYKKMYMMDEDEYQKRQNQKKQRLERMNEVNQLEKPRRGRPKK